MAAYRQTKRLPAKLANAPRMPEGCGVVWRDFLNLHAMRGSTGLGAARISYSDIDAYQRVQGVRFAPWEIEAIKRADLAFMTVHAEALRPAA